MPTAASSDKVYCKNASWATQQLTSLDVALGLHSGGQTTSSDDILKSLYEEGTIATIDP